MKFIFCFFFFDCSPEFIKTLCANQIDKELSAAQKMKLLNLNAVAKYLTTNYNGPNIQPDSDVNKIEIGYRKSKQILLDGLLDTLKSLFTNQSYIRSGYNANLGLVIGKISFSRYFIRFVFHLLKNKKKTFRCRMCAE